jgi:hypothetical protein
MPPTTLLFRIAALANPIYKIAVSTVLLYSLYHKHKLFKAENEQRRKHLSRQRDDPPP